MRKIPFIFIEKTVAVGRILSKMAAILVSLILRLVQVIVSFVFALSDAVVARTRAYVGSRWAETIK